MGTEHYQSPFSTRYASRQMQSIFSEDTKFQTWRKLWVALAKSQKELGLDLSSDGIAQMEEHMESINYEVAREKEKEFRHDVMAHIHAFAMQCPLAKPFIHLGATSCYVGDNTDLMLMRQALALVQKKLLLVMKNLSAFALAYKDMPTLGFTHFQPAQLVTVGKRACLWLQELLLDYQDIDYVLEGFSFLGSKGTTGTGASFLSLFDGDVEKVKQLDMLVAQKMGFSKVYAVSGQTYTRKWDAKVVNVLSGVAQSAYKFANDLRLLQNLKEVEEPFEESQIGSSAMAYKRNPMRSERICAIARYVMVNALNPAMTASAQWFERTLDDSANKRIVIPESFLAVDGILDIYINITSGLVVYPQLINQHIAEELPFMATENILMEAVKKGGDRQELHEAIRKHSMQAGRVVKEKGGKNDLLDRILRDPLFSITKDEMDEILKPQNYIGIAPVQVDDFLTQHIKPILDAHVVEAVEVDLKV
jgi:adenylosuccinate lyase